MNNLIVILLGIVLGLIIIWAINNFSRDNTEGWYPTTTYVNSPGISGVYSAGPTNRWRRNPYSLNWNSWRPYSIYNRWQSPNPYRRLPNPIGNPVPIDSLRWRGLFGPMLTSIKSPKDYYLGQWVHAGTAYTDNPNDFTYFDVQQLNLDPGRDLFSYRVKTKDGQIIPINLRQNHRRLEDGDRFKVQGMEGKGDFVFTEADKYNYVYTY